MGYGIRLRVWGDYACFTRPEMKVERVSYDVITPSAARGLLEAIHWKPSIKWVIDRIHVVKEIRFENIRRNEVENKISANAVKNAMNGKGGMLQQAPGERQQRATMLLRAPEYVIEAHFEMTNRAGTEDNPEKHYNIFLRRARQGQCFNQPYLGCREFDAHFELVEKDEEMPASHYKEESERDLGWMLHDIDFEDGMTPRFLRAAMRSGVVDVPTLTRGGGR